MTDDVTELVESIQEFIGWSAELVETVLEGDEYLTHKDNLKQAISTFQSLAAENERLKEAGYRKGD